MCVCMCVSERGRHAQVSGRPSSVSPSGSEKEEDQGPDNRHFSIRVLFHERREEGRRREERRGGGEDVSVCAVEACAYL